MDENATPQQSNNTPGQVPSPNGVAPQSGTFVPPVNPAQPANVVPQAPTYVPPQQPVQSQSQAPLAEEAANPRITLQDLYGPSQPHELSQPSVSPEVSVPPVVPAEQNVPQPSVSENPIQVAENPEPVAPVQPSVEEVSPSPEPQRRGSEVKEQVSPTQPLATSQQTPPAAGQEPLQDSDGSGSRGLHLPSILKYVVGGVVLLIVILIIFSIGSLLFSGKGKNSNVNLVYWGLWENPNVIQPIFDDFHKQHPNITVTYTKQDPTDYTKRLLTRMQSGDGPDIFRLHNTWVYPLQSILLPLPTSVIDAKQLSSNYPPVVTTDMVSNGATYGLPLGIDSLALFVNTDIFTHAGASVPQTWDNFITVAKALTVKDPNGHIQTAGASIGTFDNVSHAPDIVSLLLLQNGANLQKLQNASNATDALSFYTSFAKGDSSVWDSTLDNSLTAFTQGKVAMYFGYSYDIFAIQAANPNLKFSIHPVPHLPGRDMTIASYWVEGVSNRSQHQKEALELMQYLAQKDTQQRIYSEEAKTRSFGELYARTDLAQNLIANQLLAPFVNQFKSAKSSFFAADTGYVEYNGALNQYLGNAINSMLKDTSADSAASTLAQGVAQVLSNYAPKTP